MEGLTKKQESIPRKEVKFDASETFEINTDNKIYALKISYNEQLIYFEIKEKNSFVKDEYNLYINLNELGKISKFFNQFETAKEVFDSLKSLIDKKNVSIIQEEKKMKIKIINPINNKEFFINILSKEKDIRNEINSLISYVTSLNEKVQKLENKVNLLENKLNEIYVYKDYIIKKKKKDDEEEEEIRKVYDQYQIYRSRVINKNEINLFMKWLDQKPKKIKLLLDSKIDGDLTQTFYNKCGGKFPTVVFVKTTKGKRFGGYCSIGWENKNGGSLKDINNFIFSLDKKKKYKIKIPEQAVYTSSNYFDFGSGGDLYIEDKCTSNTRGYNNNTGTYETTEKYELNGESNFTVSSYEVYQIEY